MVRRVNKSGMNCPPMNDLSERLSAVVAAAMKCGGVCSVIDDVVGKGKSEIH